MNDRPHRYLLCDWNEWDGSDAKSSVNRFLVGLLEQLEYESVQAKDEAQADLVVVAPRYNDPPFSIDWLRVFHAGLGGRRKQVLYVHPKASLVFARADVLPWLFVVQSPGFSHDAFRDWLKGWNPADDEAEDSILPSGGISHKEVAGKISNTGACLLGRGSCAEAFFGLCRMMGRSASIEHGMRNRRDWWASEDANGDEEAKKKRALILAEYHTSIQTLFGYMDQHAALVLMARRRAASATDPIRLLLIDDRPDPVEKRLEKVRKEGWLDAEVETWHVTGMASSISLSSIEKFGAIHGGQQELLNSTPTPGNTTLKERLEGVDAVLVDILMGDQFGIERERGYRVLRGLTRLVADAKLDRRPAMIALSRADDPLTVERALAAGAQAFVPKHRILNVAQALLRSRGIQHGPISEKRRNFRAIRQLPAETTSLLRRVAVRQHCFRKGVAPADPRALALARLVAAVPKADLHVHAGSCMRPEFLVVASLVMLSKCGSDDVREIVERFQRLVTNGVVLPLELDSKRGSPLVLKHRASGLRKFANEVRKRLRKQLRDQVDQESAYALRSILHQGLDIPAHVSVDDATLALKKASDILLLQFAVLHAGESIECDGADVLRVFILWLGTKYNSGSVRFERPEGSPLHSHLSNWFDKGNSGLVDFLMQLNDELKAEEKEPRGGCWEIRLGSSAAGQSAPDARLLQSSPAYERDPIAYLLASGTRAASLGEYLQGCDISGAEHLQDRYLMRLYAQQVLHDMVAHGVMYAELRAAIGGYAGADFPFREAVESFRQAFREAQDCVNVEFAGAHGQKMEKKEGHSWLWGQPFSLHSLFDRNASELALHRFPARVSVVLTGKRHKTSREMAREGAAGVLFREEKDEGALNCPVVGFDLAGPEVDLPPRLFRDEYERLARNHIPITVHAGENAPAKYVEEAIFDLRASRLGHGLSLVDDPQLMRMAREQRVCVELCPVSNFQTNAFAPAGRVGQRTYPLRELVKKDNPVCINTDNPKISHTNMIKECFQAAHAFGTEDEWHLTLWDLLRILRTGFVASFLPVEQRWQLLREVDQILTDLFSRSDVIELLRIASEWSPDGGDRTPHW